MGLKALIRTNTKCKNKKDIIEKSKLLPKSLRGFNGNMAWKPTNLNKVMAQCT
jgi:hypothetical protein